MRDRPWPTVAKIADYVLNVEAHSRGLAGKEIGGTEGQWSGERGLGARWRGTLEVVPMAKPEALEFRAFLHSLRGRSGTFCVPMPLNIPPVPLVGGETSASGYAEYTDDTDFTDSTTYSDLLPTSTTAESGTLVSAAPAGADGVEVSGLSGSVFLIVGAFALVGGQLVRVVSVSGSTVGIRPRLRNAVAAGATVSVGCVTGCFRLASDTPAVPLIPGRSSTITLDVVEAF